MTSRPTRTVSRLVLALAVAAALPPASTPVPAFAQAQVAQTAPEAPPVVVRVYPVADLLAGAPSPAEAPALRTPDMAQLPSGPTFPGFVDAPAPPTTSAAPKSPPAPRPARDATTALIDLLTSLVAPDLWVDNGGLVARVEFFNNALVVSAPQAVHDQLTETLAALRASARPARPVRVELRFLRLDEPAAAEVLALPRDPKSGAVTVPDALLRKHAASTATYVLSAHPGRPTRLASGQARDVIHSVTPVVGTGAAAYQAEARLLLSGISATLTATLADTASAHVALAGSYFASAPPATPAPTGGPAPTEVNRPDLLAGQALQFSSALDLPLNAHVLLTATPLDPTGPTPGDQLLILARLTP